MGNSSAPAGEEREVLLCLHSVHNVEHSPTESYYGMATNHADEETALTSDRAATLRASVDSIISIRLHLHERGASASRDRSAGQVSIPVREMLKQCGPAIFQTWLALGPIAPYDSDLIGGAASSFKQSMQTARENVHAPRICVSFLENGMETSGWEHDPAMQATYYEPILVSHTQHLALEQAYFRQFDGQESGVDVPAPGSKQVSQLKRDLDAVTLEANRHIEKGNDTIMRLKGQLREMAEEEAPPLLSARADARARKQMAEASKQNLQARLQTVDYDEELFQLRSEATALEVQKAALMDRLTDSFQRCERVGGQAAARALEAIKPLLDANASTDISPDCGSRDSSSDNLLPDPRDILRGT